MNGRQVADAARVERPELKVLFITGYAENAVVGNGHMDKGMSLLTKPFAMAELARKIRERPLELAGARFAGRSGTAQPRAALVSSPDAPVGVGGRP